MHPERPYNKGGRIGFLNPSLNKNYVNANENVIFKFYHWNYR